MVGEDTNWPMGLAVALAINLKTLSAAKELEGSQREYQSADSPFPSFEALIRKVVFLAFAAANKVFFGTGNAQWFRFGKCARLEGKGGDGIATKRKVAWLQLMGVD